MAKPGSGVIPQLPTGVHISDRPSDLEFLVRGNAKWMTVIESLKVIDATKCVQIDISGVESHKGKLNGMKSGIKHTAKLMGFKPKVKFAVKGTLLYVWANRQ